MKYSTGQLMIFLSIACVMAASLRSGSPRSVLVMLVCVCGLLGWAAIASFFTTGTGRWNLIAATVCGCGYPVFYVMTESRVEALINTLPIVPFALLKGGLEYRNAQLGPLANTMEFQYFHQKVHLTNAVLAAILGGWYLPRLFQPESSTRLAPRQDPESTP